MSAGASVLESGRFGRFELFGAERRLEVDGVAVMLGSRAYDLLTALVSRRDRVVPKDELIEAVWPGLVVEDNNLQVQISALRKVLGPQAIATVPGRGYRFTVAEGMNSAAAAVPVPVSVPAHAAAPTERGISGPPRAPRLLVVDDNKVNRLLLARTLELLGHEVAHAANGRSALQMLRDARFDLLLLDLKMPEMDGFDLLELRSGEPTLQDVPVIVTSSLEGVADVARCIELGADDFLHKPVNPVLLRARVDSSLERKFLRDRERELLARLGVGRMDLPNANREARCIGATLLVARVVEAGLPTRSEPAAEPAAETLELLSTWTTLAVNAIEGQGGRVLQITGDGVTAVFPADGPLPSVDDATLASAEAAREMVALMLLFNDDRRAAGRPAVVQCIGIASGEVVAGHAGTPKRSGHVCVGPAVQRAAALATPAPTRTHAVLIDEATRVALAGRVATEAVPSVRAAEAPPGEPVHSLITG
jgi:DNA-binding response OmpR family regulator